MREELKTLTENDYWVYGLREDDFDYTLDLVQELINNNQEKLKVEIADAKKKYPEEDIWCEIQSDLAHYAWVNEQYLWQFCLWRIQGIFEGMILHTFLPEPPEKKLIGLKAKLNVANDYGFTLTAEEQQELFHWANLRNALSHAPPEQYRPGPVRKDDIVEYVNFIKSITKKWAVIKNSL